MRKVVSSSALFFVLAVAASAQVPTSGNVFFGYSFYHTNVSNFDSANTNGWEASLEGKVFPFLGIVADFDGHYGSENFGATVCGLGCSPTSFTVNVAEHNVLFGPRASVSVGKFRPFAEALFGVGHVNASSVGSDTSFASAFGGGLDYRVLRIFALRLQGDYVRTSFLHTDQNNLRLSTGIVFRF
jgi:hypothetical protein